MLDTVPYCCYLRRLSGQPPLPPGWRGWTKMPDASPFDARYDFGIRNDLIGIRTFGRSGIITKVECDLPKLLWGHNARPIKSQAELDEALARLKRALASVFEPLGRGTGFYPDDVVGDTQTYYTRIDLSWQFDIKIRTVLTALRNARHPSINKTTAVYEGESVTLPGINLQIRAYDKVQEMHIKHPGNVARIEVQLRGNQIGKCFGIGKDNRLAHLDINAAYAAYRKILLDFKFVLQPYPTKKGSVNDYIALQVAKHPEEDHIGEYIEVRGLKPRIAKELRRDVGRIVPALVRFSWDDLLPADHLPPVVEIPLPRQEQRVAEYFATLPAAPSPSICPTTPSFTVAA